MRTLSPIIRSTLFAATAALLVGSVASPAAARKTRPIVVPASVLKSESTKLCLPGTVVPAPSRVASGTVCQTVGEWTAQGVTIVAK